MRILIIEDEPELARHIGRALTRHGHFVDIRHDGITGLAAAQREAQAYIRALFTWRKRTPLLHDGALTHYTPADGVYVYFRHAGTAAATGPSVMVALNRTDAPVTVPLARFAPFVRTGMRARGALDGVEVDLGDTLVVPAKAATLLELP